jgi:ribosomal protein L7/L12
MDFKKIIIDNIPHLTTFELAEIKKAINDYTGDFPVVSFPNEENLKSRNWITPKEFVEKVQRYIRNKEKLQAVKYVKDELGWGLKESKDFVDSLDPNYAPSFRGSFLPTSPIPTSSPILASTTVILTTNSLIEKGSILDACKYYKDETKVGLREAKDFVDSLKNIRSTAQQMKRDKGNIVACKYLKDEIKIDLKSAMIIIDKL